MPEQSRADDEAELAQLDADVQEAEGLEKQIREFLETMDPPVAYRVGALACILLAGRIIAFQAKDKSALDEMIESSTETLTDTIELMFEQRQEAAIEDSKAATQH
jgi:hypothetical protein